MKHILLSGCLVYIFAGLTQAQVYEKPMLNVSQCTEYESERPGNQSRPEPREDEEQICLLLGLMLDTHEIITVGTIIGATPIAEQTFSTSALTEADIRNRNAAYIGELLRALPGISVNQSGPMGNLTQVRLRGAEANHTLVLIDGVEASNPNTGEFDFAGLRAEDVIRVEVLRGEQSALWGSDAVGGVINIITRAGNSNEGWSVSVEAGSFNTVEGQLSATIPIGYAALSINGTAFNTDGYDVSGLDLEDDGSQSRSLNIGLNRLELGRLHVNAKFGVSRLESEFDSDSDFNGRLDNTDEFLITENRNARIDGRFELARFDHLITGAWTQVDTSNPNSGFRNDTRGERFKANWAAKTNWDAHALTVLGEYEEESFENDGGIGAFQNQNETISTTSVAGDYRYNKGPITLTVSARADFNDRFDDAQTWRLGGGYRFDWDGRVRASIGTGVKNPTMTELFGFFPGSFIGNQDLQPETSLGYNLGYTQSFFNDDLDISVDYFRSELEDEILTVFNPDFTSTVVNAMTESTREGIEAELRWNASEALNLRGSATLLSSEENGVDEIRRPDFLASFTATWRPINDLSLTGSIDHTGDQLDTDFATFSTVTLDAFTMVGLNAAYDIDDHFTVTLRGENLLDEEYQEVVGYASQGRGIYAGLKANF